MEFLRTKKISSYKYYFEPLNKVNSNNSTPNNDGIDNECYELNIMILNLTEVSCADEPLDVLRQWFPYNGFEIEYDYVFVYGEYIPDNRRLIDIHFENFDIFKDFFEVFYYLNNGTDSFSIDFGDIFYWFGTRPYTLKCYTCDNTDDVIEILENRKNELFGVYYIEKADKSFSIFDFNNEVLDKIDTTLKNREKDITFAEWTAVISEENDETWKKLFVI